MNNQKIITTIKVFHFQRVGGTEWGGGGGTEWGWEGGTEWGGGIYFRENITTQS